MEKDFSMCNENEILQAIKDIEAKSERNRLLSIELDLTLDDFIDENIEVLASTIGGLDKDTHAIVASYYDLKKQIDDAQLEVLIAKGQIDALYKMLYSSCKYEKK
jgi:hypothetical protein